MKIWISLAAVLWAARIASAAEYEENFVIAPGHFKVNHGSSIVELSDGSLLCCWYAGSDECAPDVKIYASKFDALRQSWSPPAAVAGGGERAEGRWLRSKAFGNCALFLDEEKVLWLFYTSLPFGGWTCASVDYKTSLDEGQTWSQPTMLVGTFGNLTRGKPLALAPHKFMVPLYKNLGHKHGYTCTLTVSRGQITGKTFQDIPGPENTQPALARRGDNELVAYLRDPTWQSLLFARFDSAQGKWSVAERLNLPNPNAAVDAVQADEGKTLLVYNDSRKGRNPISLAGADNGRDFKKIWDFEYARTGGGSFSYPAIIRAANGDYHVTYSYDHRHAIKHVRFSPAWLKEKMEATPP